MTSALAAVEGFLLEPPEAGDEPPEVVAPPRAVIALAGARPGCGTTTVARALAAELAARDEASAAAVIGATPSAHVRLATPSGARLARALGATPAGRLALLGDADCLARARDARLLAPVILDASADGPAPAAAAACADHVVVVADPTCEPALAAMVAASLARVGPEPHVVLNRATGGGEGWEGRHAAALGESALGARLALAGREARSLGTGTLADLLEDELL